MKKLIALAAAGALATGFSVTASAQDDAMTEIETAHTHAVLAQDADGIDGTHMHLHHVVNCLVGPDGDAFDADEANPCADQGNGAIPDAEDDADLQDDLQDILATAQDGLDTDDADEAQASAGEVADSLQNLSN